MVGHADAAASTAESIFIVDVLVFFPPFFRIKNLWARTDGALCRLKGG